MDNLADLGRRALSFFQLRQTPGLRVIVMQRVRRGVAPDEVPGIHDTFEEIAGRVLDSGRIAVEDDPNGDADLSYLGPSIAVRLDLTDAATLGCLRARVREVWDNPREVLEVSRVQPDVVLVLYPPTGRVAFEGACEAEALVAALEFFWKMRVPALLQTARTSAGFPTPGTS